MEQQKKLSLTFERGGTLTVSITDHAPETARRVLDAFPCEHYVMQSRYCGPELSFGIATQKRPDQENATTRPKKFDVAYWRNWDSPDGEGLPGSPGEEAISFYYGDALLQFQGDPIEVNVFGRIDESEEAVLEEIGLRVWRKGFENVRVEIVE
jgi:hypothetical protein